MVLLEAMEIESGTNTEPNAKTETKASATIARENLEFLFIQQTPFFFQEFLHMEEIPRSRLKFSLSA